MFLFFNSIVASLDGLIIGISLRLSNVKLTKKNISIIFFGNLFIYTVFLLSYYYFKLSFMSKSLSTFFYLFLAYRALKEEDDSKYNNKLDTIKCLMLTTTHALDGMLVSLNFVYTYNIIHIILLFSFNAISILLVGYFFANILKNIKKTNIISSILFIILAIINYFL